MRSFMKTRFVQIEHKSKLYDQELALRDALLRRPLGLAISETDVIEDADQLHFGSVVDATPPELVACVVSVDLGNQRAKIRQMAVAETHQRQGIGTQLMKQAELRLQELGFRAIELNARVPAIEFYQRLGYIPVGDRFTEVTIEHQKMTKLLNPRDNDTQPHYSLGSLMCLMTACCGIMAMATLIPRSLLAVAVPPILGPIVSWWVLPSVRSLALGLVSAYFWTMVAVMFVGVSLTFSFDGPGASDEYKIALGASIGSIAGGYLGSQVERSRLQQIEWRRIRESKR